MKVKALLIAFAMAITSMAFAADDAKPELKIKPYIKAKTWAGVKASTPDVGDGSSEFSLADNGNSRIGVKAELGDVKVNVEYGTSGGKANLRHAYTTWNFGAGELLVGQTWTPYTAFLGNAVMDDGAYANGAMYDGRLPQIKLSAFNAYLVLLKADSSVNNDLPKVAAGYDIKFGDSKIALGGAFLKGDKGFDGNAWVGFLSTNLKFGKVSSNINFNYGVNTANYGINYNTEMEAAASKSTEDAKVLEGGLDFGYELGMVSVIVGGTYQQASNDGGTTTTKDITAFAQLPISVVKGFSITPAIEYSKVTVGDVKSPTTLTYGILFTGSL